MPHRAVSVLDGNNFVVSDRQGDVHPDSRFPPHGFFSEDTRFVSLWRLTVQGQPPDILSNAQVDYFIAQFFLASPSTGSHAAPAIGIVRQRLLGDVWMRMSWSSTTETSMLRSRLTSMWRLISRICSR
jgi:hypothetical protein